VILLKHLMIRQGHWLFRWRSYLPLLMLPIAVEVFLASGWMTRAVGPFGEDLWDSFCLLVALTGLAVRILTVGFVPRGTSGRNTGRQKADVLNTTGMYSLVRHPLYLGNFLVFMGFALLLKSGIFVLFAAVVYLAYYERIILAEEEFLAKRHGAAFLDWASETPVIAPTFRHWVAPALPFSWRSALRREFHTLFLIAVLFFASELLEGMVIERSTFVGWIAHEPQWAIFVAASGALYLAVMAIKKTTSWLNVVGR
jgi:protein-S-isoprenylcysteine O-methyltransferase Ste14